MKFVSLNDPSGEAVTFEQALARGLAPDGGLYVPTAMPTLTDVSRLKGADRYETAQTLLAPWIEDEIPAADLAEIIRRSAAFDTPLVEVGTKKVLELFHGPTLAFKDVAASYLPAFMSYFNRRAGRSTTVIVATSGDTGGAIANGFADVPGVKLAVLYPRGRISRLQLEQLRRVASNVRSLEVDGDFNDCQELVKRALGDADISRRFNLTSANSINVGRLLPQTTYYGYIYSRLGVLADRVVVPTGNLGNLTAGLMAMVMGVPVKQFIAATNANDSLERYLATGRYEPRQTVHTLSNAMDVNAPNNLPRFRWLFNDHLEAMRAAVRAVSVSDEDTIDTIKRVYAETGYLLDPHTAVGWRASELLGGDQDVIVATASPLKFAEEIFAKTGIKVDNSHLLDELAEKPERYVKIDNSLDELVANLEQLQA